MARIEGSDSSELLRGTYGGDSIYGHGGNDTLRGSFGDDWLYGGDGNDRLFGEAQDDWLYGGNGNDTLEGGAGDDFLNGGAGADLLLGGAGNDTFDARNLAEAIGDTIRGGHGIDRINLDFGLVDGAMRFAIQDPTVTVTLRFGNAAPMTFREIERFDITGTAYADRMTGWIYDDTLNGGDGNDTLIGGLGRDYLYGDDGNDLLRGGGDRDVLYGGNGNDRLLGEGGDDDLYGGAGNDTLQGGAGDDDLNGGAGRDRLVGGAGDDRLEGGTRDGGERDILLGGAGDDWLRVGVNDHANGGAGRDVVSVDFRDVTGQINWNFSPQLKEFANGTRIVNAEVLYYEGGSGRDIITGHRLDDWLEGNGGNDRLAGGAGNDTLDGGSGNDRLVGGAGHDYLIHDSGNDTLLGNRGNDVFAIGFDENADRPYTVLIDGGPGRDTVRFNSFDLGAVVDLANQSRNDGLAFGKTLRNVEVLEGTVLDDHFAGTGGRDVFYGGSGSDVLIGRGGNDFLSGGASSDILTGGAGADVFDFADFSGYDWEGDVITDFRRGQDKLRFDRDDLGGDALRLVNATDHRAPNAAPTLIFETDAKRLWYDADGNGNDDSPILIVTLNGVGQLAMSDFLFI